MCLTTEPPDMNGGGERKQGINERLRGLPGQPAKSFLYARDVNAAVKRASGTPGRFDDRDAPGALSGGEGALDPQARCIHDGNIVGQAVCDEQPSAIAREGDPPWAAPHFYRCDKLHCRTI